MKVLKKINDPVKNKINKFSQIIGVLNSDSRKIELINSEKLILSLSTLKIDIRHVRNLIKDILFNIEKIDAYFSEFEHNKIVYQVSNQTDDVDYLSIYKNLKLSLGFIKTFRNDLYKNYEVYDFLNYRSRINKTLGRGDYISLKLKNLLFDCDDFLKKEEIILPNRVSKSEIDDIYKDMKNNFHKMKVWERSKNIKKLLFYEIRNTKSYSDAIDSLIFNLDYSKETIILYLNALSLNNELKSFLQQSFVSELILYIIIDLSSSHNSEELNLFIDEVNCASKSSRSINSSGFIHSSFIINLHADIKKRLYGSNSNIISDIENRLEKDVYYKIDSSNNKVLLAYPQLYGKEFKWLSFDEKGAFSLYTMNDLKRSTKVLFKDDLGHLYIIGYKDVVPV